METLAKQVDASMRSVHHERVTQLTAGAGVVATWLRAAAHDARHRPGSTALGVGMGWLVLIGFFRFFGDSISHSGARWMFNWSVEQGYGTGKWAPLYACASIVSCVGFLLAGIASTQPPMSTRASLVLFIGSLEMAVALSVVAVSAQPTPVFHTWFYAMWPALPAAYYAGFVLIPLLVTAGGRLGSRVREPLRWCASPR